MQSLELLMTISKILVLSPLISLNVLLFFSTKCLGLYCINLNLCIVNVFSYLSYIWFMYFAFLKRDLTDTTYFSLLCLEHRLEHS